MKKLTLIALVSLFSIGCIGEKYEKYEKIDIKKEFNFRTVCVDGVEYLMGEKYDYGYFTIKYNRDGSAALCD